MQRLTRNAMSKYTPSGHLKCQNCDNPRSAELDKKGIHLCCLCCFGETEMFLEQLEAGDVIFREDKVRHA